MQNQESLDLLKLFQDTGHRAFLFADRLANAIFGTRWNPLYHLGTMAFFFFYIVLGSGIYIYIFYDTSVVDAYKSVEYLTHDQWYLGGVMRSLHRYASDAMIITMTLHLLRGFFSNRYRGARWYSWTTGIPMLWLVFAIGIVGYWLVWDKMGQLIAVRTSEWIDWLPIIAEPTARNFLTNTSITDLFFRLLVVTHIGLPLMLLGVMLLHVNRLNYAKINPPAGLAIGASLALLALSLIKPALSHEAADLSTLPTQINLDWFYLFIYPLMDLWSMGGVWALVAAGTLLLVLLPWMPPKPREPVAVVYPDDCSGCNLCVEDCPYEAIRLRGRSGSEGGGRYQHLPIAVVEENKCVSCGICTGSCPSSTPFRHADKLQTGIDMPHKNIQSLHAATREGLDKLSGKAKILVYGCDHGFDLRKLMGPEIAVVSLPCTGALPPSFIAYALRNGADGVFLTGCRSGDCFHRLGNDWVDQRVTYQRKPYLKRSVPSERVGRYWAAESDHKQLVSAIESFRQSLQDLPHATAEDETQQQPPAKPGDQGMKASRYLGQAFWYLLFIALIGYFATSPSYTFMQPDQALIKLAFNHSGKLKQPCREFTAEELASKPKHMRIKFDCPRERSPVYVVMEVDGKRVFEKTIAPSGLSKDLPSPLYERIPLPAGEYRLHLGMRDHVDTKGFDYEFEGPIMLKPSQILVIGFDPDRKEFTFE